MAEVIRIEVPTGNRNSVWKESVQGLNKISRMVEQAGISFENSSHQVSQFDRAIEKTQRRIEGWITRNFEIQLSAIDRVTPVIKEIEHSLNSFSKKARSISLKISDDVTSSIRKVLSLLNGFVFSTKPLLNLTEHLQSISLAYSNMSNLLNKITDNPMQKNGITVLNTTSIDYDKLADVISQTNKTMLEALGIVTGDSAGSTSFLQKAADIEPLISILSSVISIGQAIPDLKATFQKKMEPLFSTAFEKGSKVWTSVIQKVKLPVDIGKNKLLEFGANVATKLGANKGGVDFPTGGMSALGLGAVTGGIIAGKTVISGTMDVKRFFEEKAKGNDEKAKAYKVSGITKISSVAAGAAVGATIGVALPIIGVPVGALIGAGLGGLGGTFLGNQEISHYEYKEMLEQEAAERAKKFYEVTGYSIENVTFETKALNEAINDTNVSAEQLGQIFQEAVNDKLQKKFGDVSLSLKEIQELARGIVFHKQTESLLQFSKATQDAENSLTTLRDHDKTINKMTWKASLGIYIADEEKEAYKAELAGVVDDAKAYVEDKHYETDMALNLLIPDKADEVSKLLNPIYMDMQDDINSTGEMLMERMGRALEDGMLQTEEREEIDTLLNEIMGITDSLASAEENAAYDTMKAKYKFNGLDFESFKNLQAELQGNAAAMEESYADALEKSLTALELGKESINPEAYGKVKTKLIDGYNTQMTDLKNRLQTVQLEMIAENFDSDLVGILPQYEGTTAEKLAQAMDHGLAVDSNPENWSEKQMTKWFGLDGVKNGETLDAIVKMLQATAETIPQSIADSVAQSYTSMDESGDVIKETYNKAIEEWLSMMGNGSEKLSSFIRSASQRALSEAFAAPFDVTATINMNTSYRIMNDSSNILSGTLPQPNSFILEKANGGFVSGRQLSWIGEEGPEVVIPMIPGRRGRALDLYEQAGRMLGIGASTGASYSALNTANLSSIAAAGNNSFGYETASDPLFDNAPLLYAPVNTETGDSSDNGAKVQVNVQMTPSFHISGSETQSEESVLTVIRRHMKEMSDELGGQIAEQLERVFSNMPLHA